MPGFDGTGPGGMGPMTGGGRGFCSPWGIPRRYAFPRRMAYAYPSYGAYGFQPFAPAVTREHELEFLKSRAETLREELGALETEMEKLSTGKE